MHIWRGLEKRTRTVKVESMIERNEQVAKTAAVHEKVFGRKPLVIASAPGRFHLLGEHTWYFGGKTLSMAINRFVCVSVSIRDDDILRFHYVETGENKHINLLSLRFRKEDKWANSIKSVLYSLISGKIIEVGDDESPKIHGLDFCVSSPIPPTNGMGISTAMKVATAFALNELFDLDCPDSEILSVIERGNSEFLKDGGKNHLAENLTAMFSKKGSLVLTNHDEVQYADSFKILDFNFPEKKILLVDARVPRLSSWIEQSLMTKQNREILKSLRLQSADGDWVYEDDKIELSEVLENVSENSRRHLYGVINEQKCVNDALASIKNASFPLFARAINKSHEIMRDLYDISCPEIDWILKRLLEINPNPDKEHNPVSCGRITGQGFGRCLFVLLDSENILEFQKKLAEYTKIFGFRADSFEVSSEDGVSVQRL